MTNFSGWQKEFHLKIGRFSENGHEETAALLAEHPDTADAGGCLHSQPRMQLIKMAVDPGALTFVLNTAKSPAVFYRSN